MMYTKTAYWMRNVLIVVLFTLLFTACASNSTANTPTATATPSPTPGLTFQQFTNAGFTLQYPTSWQTSQGSVTADRPIYSFVDPTDSNASFHVELNAIYFDADTPIADLFGHQMDNGTNCKPGDASLQQPVTVNGTTWQQGDMICQVAGASYEVRSYTHTDSTNHGPFIAFGAYQTSSSASTFASLEKEVFNPMFQSAQFK